MFDFSNVTEKISLTVISSWDASEEFPTDKFFARGLFYYIYILFIKWFRKFVAY